MKYQLEEFKYLQDNLYNKIYMTNYALNTVDYVQFGTDWIKYRFSKGRKTFLLRRDDLLAVSDFTKLDRKMVEFNQALAAKLKLEYQQVCVKIPEYSKHELISAAQERFDESCFLFKEAAGQNQYPAFVGILERQHMLLLTPYMFSGEPAGDARYVTLGDGTSGAFRPTGLHKPGTDVEIWEKVIDPLCWYGKPVAGKPVSSLDEVNNYDAPLGNLEELIEEERS